MESSAKVRIAAVTPEPHEVMIGLSRSTPASVKAASMRSRGSQRAVFEHAVERHVEGAGHVAGPQSGPRLRRLAGEPLGRAGIDDLRAFVGDRHAHVGEHGDGADIHLGIEISAAPAWLSPAFQRTVFGLPFRQSAVEDVDILGAENAERPPHPRRRVETEAVVDHDGVAVADAERARRPRRIASAPAACAAIRSNDR